MQLEGRRNGTDTVRETFAVERPAAETLQRWDRLAVDTGASPFQRPGWVRTWVGCFGKPADLLVATVRRGDELVAVLPLRRRGRWLTSPANLETPRFDAVAADEAAARRLLSGVVGLRCRPLELTFLPRSGVAMTALDDVLDSSRRPALWESVRDQPRIDTTGRWEDYEVRELSPQRRSELRRKTRRLAELGALELDVRDGRERLDELLQEGLCLEAAGWKGRAGTAVLARPARHRFYTAIARWAAEAGILRLAFLRLDGEPLAFSFSIEDGGVHYGLKLAYDEEYKRFSPGILFVLRLIERNFRLPELTGFDMCGGTEDFKKELCPVFASQLRLRLLRTGPAGVLDRGSAQLREGARQAVLGYAPTPVRTWLVKAAAQAENR